MAQHSPRSIVERTIDRLVQLEQVCTQRGHMEDARSFQHARVIIQHLQQFPSDRNAYVTTYAFVWQRSYKHDLEMRRRWQRELAAYVPAIELPPVDGRNGEQWVKSVLAYLVWRSGSQWRSWRQRASDSDEHDAYHRAWRLLQDAFYRSPISPTSSPLTAPPASISELPPKKPVQSESLASSAKAKAHSA